MTRSCFARNLSALIFIACLAVSNLVGTVASKACGVGFLFTSYVKIVALALAKGGLPATLQGISQGSVAQVFRVVGSSRLLHRAGPTLPFRGSSRANSAT
jgi:hypothetical protein